VVHALESLQIQGDDKVSCIHHAASVYHSFGSSVTAYMQLRLCWHVANDGMAIELVREGVNSAVNNFMVNENHFIVRHPNIRARERSLHRFDGTHLSDTGNKNVLLLLAV
jgi:hypothetical protein